MLPADRAGQRDDPVRDSGVHGQRNEAFQEERPLHLPLHVGIGTPAGRRVRPKPPDVSAQPRRPARRQVRSKPATYRPQPRRRRSPELLFPRARGPGSDHAMFGCLASNLGNAKSVPSGGLRRGNTFRTMLYFRRRNIYQTSQETGIGTAAGRGNDGLRWLLFCACTPGWQRSRGDLRRGAHQP